MKKEWISAFYDNEIGEEELSWPNERLKQKEMADLLKIYGEIGKHLRSGNANVKFTEFFQKRLRASLQFEYDQSEKRDGLFPREADWKPVSEDKVEAV